MPANGAGDKLLPHELMAERGTHPMEIRTCPYCKQEIALDSRKCPHCREWVNRRYAAKRALVWVVPLMVIWLGFMVFGDRIMFREQKYWKHPDAIKITSHTAGQNEEDGRCVIGTMKNMSETPWDMITIQVDYYDATGRLVDTSTDYSSDTLPAGQERSFKVAFESKRRGVEYDHYRVFIAGADDASRF